MKPATKQPVILKTKLSFSSPVSKCSLALGLCLPQLAFAQASAQTSVQDHPKIAAHAVMAYTAKSYPKVFAAWGAPGVKRINDLMPQAALKVAASKECDKVDLVELSSDRSVPPKNIVFFVDCANSKRFYVSQADLTAVPAPQSQTAKMATLVDAQATQSCEGAVRAKLNNPLTFDRKFGTTSVSRAATTGSVKVEFTFEAKNNLGGSLPSKARCLFNESGLKEVTISKN